jgi:lipoate---protein ligase
MHTHLTTRAIRRLPAGAAPADTQVASGLALLAGLEHSGVPAMRWYRFEPPALLLGSSQRPSEVDLAACQRAGVPAHRRRSGGGVVLSEELLLLDLVLPAGDPLYTADVTESYRWLGEVWAAALAELGLEARVVGVAEARADAQGLDMLLKRVCFGGLSPYEVMVGERKVIGLAQVRRSVGALLQAGVYLRWAPVRTASILAASAEERSALVAQLAARVAGIHELGVRAEVDEVIRAVEQALERQVGLRPKDDDWTDYERQVWRETIPGYAELR